MAFNAAQYVNTQSKPMPVFLLLDTSGSMAGEKINSLNKSVKDMLSAFSKLEVEILVSLICFDDKATELLISEPSSSAIEYFRPLNAGGCTAMGDAFKKVKTYIEDRSVVPSKSYRPLIVLVSDGQPTDSWQKALQDLISTGRSQKCQRLALAIGKQVNMDLMETFVGGLYDNNGNKRVFEADDASSIAKFFEFVTMSVEITTQQVDPPKDVEPVETARTTPQNMPFKPSAARKPANQAQDNSATQDNSAAQDANDAEDDDYPF